MSTLLFCIPLCPVATTASYYLYQMGETYRKSREVTERVGLAVGSLLGAVSCSFRALLPLLGEKQSDDPSASAVPPAPSSTPTMSFPSNIDFQSVFPNVVSALAAYQTMKFGSPSLPFNSSVEGKSKED